MAPLLAVTPPKGPVIEPVLVSVPMLPPLVVTPRLTPDEIVPELIRLVRVPLTVTAHCAAVEMVPLLIRDEAVAVDKMVTGSPFLPLPAVFETVTPELIVTLAPLSSFNGLEPAPEQLALIVSADETAVPPLHNAADALPDESTAQQAIKDCRKRILRGLIRVCVMGGLAVKRWRSQRRSRPETVALAAAL